MAKGRMLLSWLILLSLACTFGQGLSSLTPTAAPTATSEAEAAVLPTMTSVPSASSGGCTLNATYVADVTIPDNTVVQPGAGFTKVWRIRNSGTCDWEPGTQLVFVAGEPLTAIGAVPVPSVAAGAETDISVEMTAPTMPGTYKSVWQLQAPNGQRFGSQIYVQIVVPASPTATPLPPATPLPTDTPLPLAGTPAIFVPTPFPTLPVGRLIVKLSSFEPMSRGQVEGSGEVRLGVSNAGDTGENVGLEAFLTFNIAEIPDNAAIVGAWLEFPTYDTLSYPFGALGCLAVFEQDYGTLDAGDYVHLQEATGAVQRYCSLDDIAHAEDFLFSSTAGLEAKLSSNLYQIRLQFDARETDSDGVADVFRSTPHLFVRYVP